MERRPADSMIGMFILDQYFLVELLGQGGMSEVYLAEQAAMERHAAVKILKARRALDDQTAERFRKEAKAVSRLSHQHIVTVYNFGELEDGSLFLAMEYVDGASLDRLLANEGPLPVPRAINIIYQCANALGYAHTRKIVHRDFKPENVMITSQLGRDHVKVLDFGIARFLDDTGSSQPGSIVGTPQYLSPEQCRGEPASPLSDQYSLGLVFYELVTGEPAVSGCGVLEVIHKHQRDAPRPPLEIRPDPSVELVQPIILRMLAKTPAERFSGMLELRDELRAAAAALDGQGGQRSAPPSFLEAAGPAPVLAPGAGLGPTRATPVVILESDTVVDRSGQDQLVGDGFSLTRELERSEEDAPRVFLLGTTAERWRDAHERWCRALPAQKILTCVNAPLDPFTTLDPIKQCSHVIIGPHPLEPIVVSTALRWMQGRSQGVAELVAGRTMHTLLLAGSALKSQCIESVIEDLRANGVRRPARRATRQLLEEMLMNALYHAPLGAAGWHSPLHADPAQPVTLRPGQESILRWAVNERFIVVSVRDPFGALTATEIVSALAGPAGQRPRRTDRRGGGLGLRIMAQAASHLMVLISPGRSTEVLAMVGSVASTGRGGQSFAVLQGWDRHILQIGDNLWLHEATIDDAPLLLLRGDVNERCDLSKIFGRAGTVHLDLSEVSSINSQGIHLWLTAYRARDPSLRLLFSRCSPAMVVQLGQLPTLAQTGTVVSIMAPYFCATCNKECLETLKWDDLVRGPNPPRRTCLVCSSDLEFDELVEEYFAFLGDHLDGAGRQ